MKQLSLDEIDANFHVPKTVTDTDITWRDVRQAPFAVYGLYDYKNTVPFRRMPPPQSARGLPSFPITLQAGGCASPPIPT